MPPRTGSAVGGGDAAEATVLTGTGDDAVIACADQLHPGGGPHVGDPRGWALLRPLRIDDRGNERARRETQ